MLSCQFCGGVDSQKSLDKCIVVPEGRLLSHEQCAYVQTDGKTERQRDGDRERKKYRETERQRDRKIDRQRDRVYKSLTYKSPKSEPAAVPGAVRVAREAQGRLCRPGPRGCQVFCGTPITMARCRAMISSSLSPPPPLSLPLAHTHTHSLSLTHTLTHTHTHFL